jgi:hypothetical protein
MTEAARTVRERHLLTPGPKRILALDGGGVRGIVSLAFLERMETVLQERSGRHDFCLADYFDLIGGTSTGSLIAAALALGYSVRRLSDLYLALSQRGFRKRLWFMGPGLFAPKFDEAALRAVIIENFGSMTLGSDDLRCGLGIVAKRLDTASVWLFHNHPRGPYFAPENPSSDFIPNSEFLLADLLLASTAAPSYFAPELIEVAPGIKGLFVDGGVSPHTNPALLMLMLATVKGYGFRWPVGTDRLMLASVGTGSTSLKSKPHLATRRPSSIFAAESLRSLMDDSDRLGQMLLQWMSNSPTPWFINSEIGNLEDDVIGETPFLHYLRYDAPMLGDWLAQHLGLALGADEIASIREMDRPENVQRLLEIGRLAAAIQIQPEHFPSRFDVGAEGSVK